MGNRLRSALIIGVVGVWIFNYTLPLFVHQYNPPQAINSTVLTLVGTLLVTYPKKKDDEDDKE